MHAVPAALSGWNLSLKSAGMQLDYTFDANAENSDIAALLRTLGDLGIVYKDLNTHQSSLEDIFVSLVHDSKGAQS
jgi:ABC-2 type transport system ATP-binding protein